jgi:hypothetical protein
MAVHIEYKQPIVVPIDHVKAPCRVCPTTDYVKAQISAGAVYIDVFEKSNPNPRGREQNPMQIGLEPQDARAFAEALIKLADQIENGIPED